MDFISPKNAFTDFLQEAIDNMGSIQLALELLANIYSIDEEDEESSESSFISLLLNKQIIHNLFNICLLVIPKKELTPIPARAFFTGLEVVQIRSLAALNNIFLIGALKDSSTDTQAEIKEFWALLFSQLVQNSLCLPIPLDRIESITAVLWSIIHFIPNLIVIAF